MTEISEENIDIRHNAVSRFSSIFNDTKKGKELAVKIEESIYDWTIERFRENGNYDDFCNPQFKNVYVMKLTQIYSNIKKGSYIDNNFLNKEVQKKGFDTDKLPTMSPIELFPDKWQDLLNRKHKLDEINYTADEQVITDQYLCTRCQTRKCTYYQRQMRSADEPATYFVTCTNCGNSWKF